VQKDDVDLACKKFSRFVNPLESLFLEKWDVLALGTLIMKTTKVTNFCICGKCLICIQSLDVVYWVEYMYMYRSDPL
jgi:hypothetical protein